MGESKQKQQVVVEHSTGKRFIMQQEQQMRVYEPDDFDGYCEGLYEICKQEGKPVLPAVKEKLIDVAIETESSLGKAAKYLGIGRSSFDDPKCLSYQRKQLAKSTEGDEK